MEDFNVQFTRPGAENQQNPGGNYAAYAYMPQGRKGKKKWIIAGIILLVVIIAVIAAAAAAACSSDSSYAGGDPYVGILHIEGEISSSSDSTSTYQQDWLLDQVETMKNDDSNEGILLYVDSPGGSVYPTDELYLKLMEYKEETDRPIYAYFGETAASGAYYISMAADWISANRNCTTGSVGVYVGPIIDASGLLDKVGIKVEIVKSAENKAMGNSYQPLTDEQRQIYQDYVNECYEQFVSIVADGRGMTVDQVKPLADGRIYTASDAEEKGLIDEVETFEEAEDGMKEALDLDCDFTDIAYVPETNLMDILMGMTSSNEDPAQTDLQIAMDLLNGGSAPEVKYLMS